MFTRLLVGLDGSPRADGALEQAVVLGERFHSTITVAHVRESGGGAKQADAGAMLERARERDVVLAELAKPADAVLVGRHGVTSQGEALGPTVASLIRIAERCVV